MVGEVVRPAPYMTDTIPPHCGEEKHLNVGVNMLVVEIVVFDRKSQT